MVAPFLKQAWTVSAVLSNMVGQGMLLSYTASLLPALQDPHSSIQADLHMRSWIASSLGLAGIPGILVSSALMDIYGRKITHLFIILPGIIGWLATYFAQDVATLIVGRVLGGITAGGTVTLGAIVIGEYSSPEYRGVFLNLKTASVCLGSMCVHILAHFMTWRTVALISTIPYIMSFIIILTWPESPAWLASIGEFDKSRNSYYWLRGRDETSDKELKQLIDAQTERLSKPKVKNSVIGEVTEFFKKFRRRDFVYPLFIVIVSCVVLESSGRHIFPAYAPQIMGEITGSKTQSFYYTLGIDIIITASAVGSSILVKLIKRRTLLFSTGFAAVAILMVVCTYLMLAYNGTIPNDQKWIPIGIFVVYFILANLGSTPIPLALLGEVFPLPHRGIGSAVSGVWLSLAVMMGLQITPYLLVHFKVHGAFFVLGVTLGLCLLILYFILPETKDKTLQEIENYFNIGRFEDEEKDENVKDKMVKSQDC